LEVKEVGNGLFARRNTLMTGTENFGNQTLHNSGVPGTCEGHGTGGGLKTMTNSHIFIVACFNHRIMIVDIDIVEVLLHHTMSMSTILPRFPDGRARIQMVSHSDGMNACLMNENWIKAFEFPDLS
jgi:hypothetical protein